MQPQFAAQPLTLSGFIHLVLSPLAMSQMRLENPTIGDLATIIPDFGYKFISRFSPALHLAADFHF
jgi:hypothetical protein